MTEEWLQQNALWVIMDPWISQPLKDNENNLDINQHNYNTYLKILEYLSQVKHVCVACDEPIYPELIEFPNVKYNTTRLYLLAKNRKCENLVYCGFHYGRCIVRGRPNGTANMSKLMKCWVKKDLCGFFSCEKIPTVTYADEITKKYAEIF
jgi:hypothetical protein